MLYWNIHKPMEHFLHSADSFSLSNAFPNGVCCNSCFDNARVYCIKSCRCFRILTDNLL